VYSTLTVRMPSRAKAALGREHPLAVLLTYTILTAAQRCQQMAGNGSGFNGSTQHSMFYVRRRSVDDKAKTADPLQRKSEGPDVGSLAKGRISQCHRTAVLSTSLVDPTRPGRDWRNTACTTSTLTIGTDVGGTRRDLAWLGRRPFDRRIKRACTVHHQVGRSHATGGGKVTGRPRPTRPPGIGHAAPRLVNWYRTESWRASSPRKSKRPTLYPRAYQRAEHRGHSQPTAS